MVKLHICGHNTISEIPNIIELQKSHIKGNNT